MKSQQGQIFPAGIESQERPALLRNMLADCSSEHRVAGFERVEDRTLRDRAFDFKVKLGADMCQRSQMVRENNADHESVWTSTDNTAGRSRTMGLQLSPASSVRNTPATEMAMKIRLGLLRSRRIVCNPMPPAPGAHLGPDPWPRNPASSCHDCPPSVVRNKAASSTPA